jgi:hypothetical protein
MGTVAIEYMQGTLLKWIVRNLFHSVLGIGRKETRHVVSVFDQTAPGKSHKKKGDNWFDMPKKIDV